MLNNVQRKQMTKCFLGLNHTFQRSFQINKQVLDSSKFKNKNKTFISKWAPLLFRTSFRAAMNLIIKSDGVKTKAMWI